VRIYKCVHTFVHILSLSYKHTDTRTHARTHMRMYIYTHYALICVYVSACMYCRQMFSDGLFWTLVSLRVQSQVLSLYDYILKTFFSSLYAFTGDFFVSRARRQKGLSVGESKKERERESRRHRGERKGERKGERQEQRQ